MLRCSFFSEKIISISLLESYNQDTPDLFCGPKFNNKKLYKQLVIFYTNSTMISRLMLSITLYYQPLNVGPITKKIIGYSYHSVIVITFGPAQTDHFKRIIM